MADATAVRHAVALIVRHRAEPTVVVLSAMAGVTDALLGIAKRAVNGDVAGGLRESARLRARHVDVARAVLRAGPGSALKSCVPWMSRFWSSIPSYAGSMRCESSPREPPTS